MASNLRVRAQETTLQFVVDTVLLQGSFAKSTDWKAEPKAEITETDFTGEPETDFDINTRGFGGSATLHKVDAAIEQLFDRIIEANRAGKEMPVINIICTTKFRSSTQAPRIETFEEVKFKLDSTDASGKDFVKSSISWACKRRKVNSQ